MAIKTETDKVEQVAQGERLAFALTNSGVKPIEIAKRAGLKHISEMLSGAKPINWKVFKAIASFPELGPNAINYVLTGETIRNNKMPSFKENVISFDPAHRITEAFLKKSGIQLDDEGKAKLIKFFRKRYQSKLEALEQEVLSDVGADIVELLK